MLYASDEYRTGIEPGTYTTLKYIQTMVYEAQFVSNMNYRLLERLIMQQNNDVFKRFNVAKLTFHISQNINDDRSIVKFAPIE